MAEIPAPTHQICARIRRRDLVKQSVDAFDLDVGLRRQLGGKALPHPFARFDGGQFRDPPCVRGGFQEPAGEESGPGAEFDDVGARLLYLAENGLDRFAGIVWSGAVIQSRRACVWCGLSACSPTVDFSRDSPDLVKLALANEV